MSTNLTVRRAGFTLTEMVMVIAVFGIMATILFPKASAVLQRGSAAQAAGVIASDLEQAVSLAARQRKPVRLSCDCAAGTYSVTDRASGATLFTRVLGGPDGHMTLSSLNFSTSPIDIFPNGMTSSALTVTVGASSTTRQVTMSTGGFVRFVR